MEQNMMRKIEISAHPTVATMDMGLQYEFISAEGAGDGLGNMGSWPLLEITPEHKEMWIQIIPQIISGSALTKDVSDIELKIFAHYTSCFVSGNCDYDASILTIALQLLQNGDSFISLLTDNKLTLYSIADKETALQDFWDYWCAPQMISWDEMSEGDLEEWLEKIEDGEFDEMMFGSFGDIYYRE